MNYYEIDESETTYPIVFQVGTKVKVNSNYPSRTEIDRNLIGKMGILIGRFGNYWRVRLREFDSCLCLEYELDIIE